MHSKHSTGSPVPMPTTEATVSNSSPTVTDDDIRVAVEDAGYQLAD